MHCCAEGLALQCLSSCSCFNNGLFKLRSLLSLDSAVPWGERHNKQDKHDGCQGNVKYQCVAEVFGLCVGASVCGRVMEAGMYGGVGGGRSVACDVALAELHEMWGEICLEHWTKEEKYYPHDLTVCVCVCVCA